MYFPNPTEENRQRYNVTIYQMKNISCNDEPIMGVCVEDLDDFREFG